VLERAHIVKSNHEFHSESEIRSGGNQLWSSFFGEIRIAFHKARERRKKRYPRFLRKPSQIEELH
jgi:hypothetical protein